MPSCNSNSPENRMTTHDPIPARLAALKTTTTPDLKAQWRDLFDSEPPPFNRRYLESRLAYRIQELAYGGLKPETIRRLERLGEELDGGDRRSAASALDRTAHHRHAADPRMAGRRARRHRHRRRLRMAGAALQVAVRHRPRHHRHALERLGVLRAQEPQGADMTKPPEKSKVVRKLRCAIYTRKSSEEGLEQEFNSLHAQREACEAYIASQRSEGWVLVRDQYDDGGISGGTLERPGLQRLLEDIEDGLVDVVVVYKIDRLSRSLADFAKLVEVFDRNGVTFVSVTQSFNTTTSMGRLTLNILLSFAQFEREVTAERIRDKVAASRRRACGWAGCRPTATASRTGSWWSTKKPPSMSAGSSPASSRSAPARNWRGRSAKRGIRTPRGNRIDKKYLYRMLNNRAYIGEAVHKGESYPGEHDAIIDRETWDRVHAILQESPRKRAARTRAETPALLKGLLFGPDGAAFSPTHTRKGDRLYRYYVSQTVLKHGAGSCPVGRVPAGEIEAAVIDQLRAVFRQPEIVAGTWKAARAHADDITEADARAALQQLDPLWDELFPAEQARIVALLVERVDIGTDGLNVRLRVDGLGGLAREMLAGGIGGAA
jgi:site-specific DNA recombinase